MPLETIKGAEDIARDPELSQRAERQSHPAFDESSSYKDALWWAKLSSDHFRG